MTQEQIVKNIVKKMSDQEKAIFISFSLEEKQKIIEKLLLIELEIICKIKNNFDNNNDFQNKLVNMLELKLNIK